MMPNTLSPPRIPKPCDPTGRISEISHVLIVGPFSISRLGIRVLLSQICDAERIAEADNLQTLASRLSRDKPDLVLLDLEPRHTDIRWVLELLDSRPRGTRVLILGDRPGSPSRVDALIQAGIDGWIDKHNSRAEWSEALSALGRGARYFTRRVRADILREPLSPPTAESPHPLHSLSNREVQVFQWIGCGHSTRDIATRLTLSPKTIETYREHIKTKLGLANGTELIRAAGQWVEQGVIDAQSAPSAPHANAR